MNIATERTTTIIYRLIINTSSLQHCNRDRTRFLLQPKSFIFGFFLFFSFLDFLVLLPLFMTELDKWNFNYLKKLELFRHDKFVLWTIRIRIQVETFNRNLPVCEHVIKQFRTNFAPGFFTWTVICWIIELFNKKPSLGKNCVMSR